MPVAIGRLFCEKILARHQLLQAVVAAAAVALCCAGLFELGQARREMVNAATAQAAVSSYVDQGSGENPTDPGTGTQPSESDIHNSLGQSMFLIAMAAELMLGLMVAHLAEGRQDEDYTAWRKLKTLNELIDRLQNEIAELHSAIEIAKKKCTAGILRAENVLRKRRPPYHRALAVLVFLIAIPSGRAVAQTITRDEGILIDTSGSVGRGGAELFRQYLLATRHLLLTQPPNSRVWVSLISTDSFGGTQEVLKGWTPEARGVSTSDLNRARHQLAAILDEKSSGISPEASGTDIFGSLWHMKVVFESVPESDKDHPVTKTIWIFSDMVNETRNFPMPSLLALGPEQILARAKANGLVVPLHGFRIHVAVLQQPVSLLKPGRRSRGSGRCTSGLREPN